MASADQDSEVLARQIASAFEPVVYPGDDNLTESTYGEEPAALVEAFRGKDDWRALDAAFLDPAPDGWGTALSFFSPAAYRFYLPAYLLADLRRELETSDPVARLCTYVTPQAEGQKIAKFWGGGTMGRHARRTFEGFDCRQVAAIVSYLWWRLAEDANDLVIEQALEHYWLPREAACADGGDAET